MFFRVVGFDVNLKFIRVQKLPDINFVSRVCVLGRLRQSHRVSEQSQALLREESSDSGVDDQVGKYSEEVKRDSIVQVDASTGSARYGSAKKLSSADVSASSYSLKSSVHCSTRSSGHGSGRVSLSPTHFFHTVVFDCAGWTFIDTMGVDQMQQVRFN